MGGRRLGGSWKAVGRQVVERQLGVGNWELGGARQVVGKQLVECSTGNWVAKQTVCADIRKQLL